MAVAAASLAACDSGGDSAPTTTVSIGPDQDTGGVQIQLDGGAVRTTDGTVDVQITAPAEADQVQIDVDPTFGDAPWTALSSPIELALHDGGYQMVFARVRTGDSGGPSAMAVAGIDVDLTYDAATASNDGDSHRASWARLVAPDVVQVRVETGRVIFDGDSPQDAFIGEPLDTSGLDEPQGFELEGTSVVDVSRVSRPYADSDLDESPPLMHDFYLTLASPLPVGESQQLTFPGGEIEPLEFSIDPAATVSPAVHVNQVGFAPDDDGKFALVSAWTGIEGGITYPDSMTFDVVDAASGDVAFSGSTKKRTGDVIDEWQRGDLTGAEVHEADFSQLAQPGRYRVCVEQMGCSETFAVSQTATWRRAAVAVARALYHQRSGAALGQPYTSIERPRSFHPDDGTVFQQTTLTMVDDPNLIGIDDRFGEYPENTTGETVDDAWGGHYDAGDWNSRIQHLEFLRAADDLVRLYPETFADLDLDIPESGDAIPDVIDEGLWSLDQFMRLQTDEGGIPGNVDQERFGEDDEASWDNDLEVYVFAPDMWSTYLYTSVAAKTAVVLRSYDSGRADQYAASATKAMEWAEAQFAENESSIDPNAIDDVTWQRASAAASMLALDQNDAWNDVFAAASTLDDGPLETLHCHDLGECEAVWEYSQVDRSLTRAPMIDNAVESIRINADSVLDAQQTAAYAWNMEFLGLNLVWGLGPSTPHGYGLLRAYVVTGDEKYRTAMVRSASFALGGNPLNTSFGTGLGAVNPRYPLIVDFHTRGVPVWPGTFEYGVHDLNITSDDDWIENDLLNPAGAYPNPLDVPVLWSWYDVSPVAAMNEFTVSQSHAPSLWTFGVLAATD